METPFGIINPDLIMTILSMLIGALITFLAARIYYEKASRDLADEAKELRRLNVLMLRGFEDSGLAEFSRDDNGNIKGMVINGSGAVMAGSASMKAEGTVIRKEDNEK